MDCLRKRKVDEILSVSMRVPDHLSAFGPIVDSIVVPLQPNRDHLMMNRINSPLNSKQNNANSGNKNSGNRKDSHPSSHASWQYDLMFGVNRVETPCMFAAQEEMKGIDGERRDRVLRTLVRNMYDFHQQVMEHR